MKSVNSKEKSEIRNPRQCDRHLIRASGCVSFIGSCPELFYGGCHGSDEREVFDHLCQIVEETIDLYKQNGKPLPHPLGARDLVNTLQRVA